MMYIPDATYRLQLNANFNFSNCEKILEYLYQLGISTVYASPITQATTGSRHGYDITDPGQIHPEIGTEEELAALLGWLRQKGMGWLQDIVPNHMALSPENSRLMDVLERGPLSLYYDYFDINWEHPSCQGKLMLFELPDSKPDMAKLELTVNENGFYLVYDQLRLPLSLPALNILQAYFWSLGGKDPALKPLATLITRVVMIPQPEVWAKYKHSIFRYLLDDEECKRKIVGWTEKLSADSIVKKKILQAQYYSLRSYREAGRAINYRRFFTVNSLICLSMEKKSVFDDYHTMLKRLYQQGLIQGLRIDHIDGLANPATYLQRLRNSFGQDCYIVAEKILGKDESLPADWPLQGTSGYEFVTMINQLFTVNEGFQALKQWYHDTIDGSEFLRQTVLNRMKILERSMKGEWENLYNLFLAAEAFPPGGKWMDALGAWICCMPVYRCYPRAFPLPNEELRILRETTETAVQNFPSLQNELYDLLKILQGATAAPEEKILPLLTRTMQFTGPLMAKGVEDTSFYTWNAWIARNEVGDAPDRISPDAVANFHQAMQERSKTACLSLNTTATHDTKRGEDARVRLLTITADPGNWLNLVEFGFNVNQKLLKRVKGKAAPSRNDEYFIYQTIAGAFPPDGIITKEWLERLKQYWLKALREAKTNSSWDDPDQAYENACMEFVDGLFSNHAFQHRLQQFVKETDQEARVFSLSQLLLKLTAPGIPDIYQGCELPDYSFVDPDNRRPVDYGRRMQLLKELQHLPGKNRKSWWEEQVKKGADKLFVCSITLSLRRQQPLLFSKGTYIPLEQDACSRRISFARQWGNTWVIISCPLPGWRQEQSLILHLPPGAPECWLNLFTGEQLLSHGTKLTVYNSNDHVKVLLMVSQHS